MLEQVPDERLPSFPLWGSDQVLAGRGAVNLSANARHLVTAL